MFRVLLAACLVIGAVGCSSSPGKSDGGEDGGLGMDGGSRTQDAGPSYPACNADGGAPCNAVPASGIWVTEQLVAQNPPAAAGGTVVDGTYFLTAITSYTGPGGTNDAGTNVKMASLIFDGGTVETLDVSKGALTDGGACEDTQTLSVTFGGKNVTPVQTCPGGCTVNCPSPSQYTATATTFELYEAKAAGVTRVNTYTKQ